MWSLQPQSADGLGLAEERRDKTSEGILLDWLVPNSRKEVVVLGIGHKIRNGEIEYSGHCEKMSKRN